MSEMLISVPRIPGSGSEATTIPVQDTRRKVAKLCRVALIALPILVSAAATMASEDAHTFPGATCQPQLSTDPVRRNDEGRMVNDGTAAQTWICPVARDAVDNNNGVEAAQIIVVGPVASCSFYSMTENGGTVHIASPDRTIPRGNLRVLEYGAGDDNIPSRPGGFYHFRCRIPPDSGVVMYRLDENNDDEN